MTNWQIIEYDEVASTNDVAMNLSSQDNVVVTARRQTKGKGRIGREWISLYGNLFMSLRLKFDLKDNAALVFMVSLALLDVIRGIDENIDIKLKWPNDVLIGGKKVSGILLEVAEDGFVVVGVGVNIVSAPDSTNLIYPATSLADEGIDVERMDFLTKYLERFDVLMEDWQRNGLKNILDRWLQHVDGLNKMVVVKTPKEVKNGVLAGVDEYGRMLLKNNDIIEPVSAGDVFFEKR